MFKLFKRKPVDTSQWHKKFVIVRVHHHRMFLFMNVYRKRVTNMGRQKWEYMSPDEYNIHLMGQL